jgi:hypothetical protein
MFPVVCTHFIYNEFDSDEIIHCIIVNGINLEIVWFG